MKPAAMPVRPIHHGRNADCKLLIFLHFLLYFNHLKQKAFTPKYRSITLVTTASRWHCTQIAHEMATIVKLSSGNYRVQVRRKGQYASKTFRRKADAYAWALEAERRSDQGRAIKAPKITGFNTFGQLIDLHIVDMLEVGKPLGRSKEFALRTLRKHLGKIKLPHLSRERIIEFGRLRAKQGAGPATLSADISYIHTIISHSAAVHGVKISTEEIDLARIALRRLGLIGRSNERDRRPTQKELDRLISYFENFSRTEVPVARIIKFAVATGMRQSEICRITWEDVDIRTRCVTVRDRKDPRKKQGNHQRVPMLDLTGYDAWALLEEQRFKSASTGRVFPYNPKTVGTYYRRGRDKLGIEDLKFHDFRHEATSRLFEAGLPIEKVALVTGHKDWKMLKRYTHLDPAVVFAEYRPHNTSLTSLKPAQR